MTSRPRVMIVGGGLSGLCLAQALVQEGFEVDVFERDAGPDVRGQGYRLTIDPVGSQALRACLPAKQYEFIRSSSGKTDKASAFIYLDERARELHRLRFNRQESEEHGLINGQVDRETLRRGLLSGIEDHVHFSKVFSRYEEGSDCVVAWFEDGTSVQADILVGADGVNSGVRHQRFPALNPTYTGNVAIFGRTSVGGVKLAMLQTFLDAGGITALGPHGRAFFCTTMRFREDPNAAATRLGIEVGHISANDYMMWAITFHADQPHDPAIASSDPAALHAVALNEIGGFHPDFRSLVEKSEPNEAALVRVKAMPRFRSGRASRVSLMGDAIHAMPPFGAHGANTSLRDSQTLGAALIRGNSSSVKAAVAAYEAEMRAYSYEAVRSARWMMRLATADFPFKKDLLVTFMRIAGAFSR